MQLGQPGQPARKDTEYVRGGVAAMMFFGEPAARHRETWVTERRWTDTHGTDMIFVNYSERIFMHWRSEPNDGPSLRQR